MKSCGCCTPRPRKSRLASRLTQTIQTRGFHTLRRTQTLASLRLHVLQRNEQASAPPPPLPDDLMGWRFVSFYLKRPSLAQYAHLASSACLVPCEPESPQAQAESSSPRRHQTRATHQTTGQQSQRRSSETVMRTQNPCCSHPGKALLLQPMLTLNLLGMSSLHGHQQCPHPPPLQRPAPRILVSPLRRLQTWRRHLLRHRKSPS